jgi:inorganic triphosphatase YgiF
MTNDFIMDRQSLEFLGNLFLAAAKGQKQLEDMNDWIGGKKGASDEWTAMFRRYFGLEKEALNSNAYTQAMQQFQTTVSDWLSLIDVVPKSKFEALQEENEELRQKLAVQQKTIQQLEGLFGDKGTNLRYVVQEFSQMAAQQSDQFQKLMENMSEMFKANKESSKE